MSKQPFRRSLDSQLSYLGQIRAMREFAVKENLITAERAAVTTDGEMASIVENHCIDNDFRIYCEEERVSIVDLKQGKESITSPK